MSSPFGLRGIFQSSTYNHTWNLLLFFVCYAEFSVPMENRVGARWIRGVKKQEETSRSGTPDVFHPRNGRILMPSRNHVKDVRGLRVSGEIRVNVHPPSKDSRQPFAHSSRSHPESSCFQMGRLPIVYRMRDGFRKVYRYLSCFAD